MFERILEFIKGDSSATQMRRLRRTAERSHKVCEFCFANVSCDLQVCKNCLSPFAKGLGSQKWLAAELERQDNYMEKLDSVKYRASKKVELLVSTGRQTLQKMSLTGKFGTAST